MLHVERAVPTDEPRSMEIDENELWILSYYGASELAGALVLGRLASQVDDDDLRVRLTEHCAEEANHAWLWTETILEVGGTPRRVSETYQTRYFAAIGPPASVLEVLALTQVFERRVMRHFRDHLRRPDIHPAVARTLRRMIAEEVGHIGWVKERLDRYAREGEAGAVHAVLRRFAEVDRRVYAGLVEHRERFRELVDPNGRGMAWPSDSSSGPPPDSSRPEVERLVRETVAETSGIHPENVDSNAPLGMLGVGSLDLVAIVGRIEEALGVELSPADLERLNTLEDLIDALIER
jgi:acyl carrier protein/bacterioferritin (cytochrome b1)